MRTVLNILSLLSYVVILVLLVGCTISNVSVHIEDGATGNVQIGSEVYHTVSADSDMASIPLLK